MKRAFFSLLMLVSVLYLPQVFSQEESDYEITQKFLNTYHALEKQIEASTTMEECTAIDAKISDLEKMNRGHKEFLDRALYPDNFETKFSKIRAQLSLAREHISVLQSQGARIAELEAQVKILSEQVERLSNENASLLAEAEKLRATVSQDRRSLDSLKTLVSRLKAGIRDRDQAIYAMVDSIFLQYDKNISGIPDIEKKKLTSQLEKNDVLTNVKKAIGDNLAFLDYTILSGEDISGLVAEQQKFSSQWRGLGPKLATIYVASKDRAKEVAIVDTMLSQWKVKINEATWRAVNKLFSTYGISVKHFASGEELAANVNAFIEDEINNVSQKKDDERYKTFSTFMDSIWNPQMSESWLPLLRSGGMMTDIQIEAMKRKVEAWESTVSPPRTALYVTIAVIILLTLIVMYSRMKRAQRLQT